MKVKVGKKEFDSKILFNTEENSYRIEILDNSNVMGYATFRIKRNRYQDSIWLYKIETYPKYAHTGVGTATINLLEYFALQNRAQVVEGKFYPENEFAKPFYNKFGYSIDREDYETYIYKTLDYTKIKENIEPNITKYEEQLDEQNELSM